MGVPWLTRHSFFYVFMSENSLEAVLQELMATAQIPNWQQLSHQTGISAKRLRKLRYGQSDHLKLSELINLSQSLQVSLAGLLERWGLPSSPESISPPASSLTEFQLTSIQAIESFLTYWPAAAHQAQINPEFPARKLLPLVKSIEQLLVSWEVAPLQAVGTTLPFNPQQHQSIDGHISPGEMVMVRYPGYQQRDKLLWRSQVSRW